MWILTSFLIYSEQKERGRVERRVVGINLL